MAGTRKDDLWGCIDFHQEDAETPNAELLWRRGIQIVVRCFPDRQRLIDQAQCWTPRCVVQCSDFSGPSRRARELLIREASANPMTVEEHIRAGSLVEVPGSGYQEDAEPADY